MTIQVKFAAKAGGQIEGALSEAPGQVPAGGVVVVQEWHGVNAYVRATVDRLAASGFLALAPDLYHGKLATTTDQAAQMMGALDKKKAVAEIGDAARFLERHARSNGKVGVVGFCMGGALAFAAALHVAGLAAAAVFYGLPDITPDELAHVRIPVQAHFARKDDWAKASVAAEIERKVRAAGGRMDLYVYDAGHAFMRSTDPHVYEPESAKLAWERLVEFLKRELA